MATLRTDYERDQATKKLGGIILGFCILALLSILWMLILTAVAYDNQSSFDTAKEQRISLNQVMSPEHTVEQRQDTAQSILALEDSGTINLISDSARSGLISASDIRAAVQHVASTGEPLQLPVGSYSAGAIVVAFTFITMLFIAVVLSFPLGAYVLKECYSTNSSDDSNFIIDVNHRRIWPVFALALCVLWWPAYVISAIRYRKAKRLQKDVAKKESSTSSEM